MAEVAKRAGGPKETKEVTDPKEKGQHGGTKDKAKGSKDK